MLKPILSLSAALIAASSLSLARPAHAQQMPRGSSPVPAVDPSSRGGSLPPLRWIPDRPRFRTSEYVLTGAAAATVLTTLVIGPRSSHLHGGVLADEATRDALRLEGSDARWFARDLSDVLLTTMISYPYVIDALVVAGWYRRSSDVAVQMALINTQTLAVTLGLQGLLNVLVSRERPFGRTCGTTLPEDSRDCNSNNRYYSFFSGHTSQSFASAGLICSHHLHLKLHGGGAADTIPCVAGFAMAASVGLLRIMADEHYLSDVLTGAALGTLTGLGLPWLLHYRYGEEGREDKAAEVTVRLVPMALGAGVVGSF